MRPVSLFVSMSPLLLLGALLPWLASADRYADNCAALAAGFPVYIATQLCVTCPAPPPPTVHQVSSEVQEIALIAILGTAGFVLLLACIVGVLVYRYGTRSAVPPGVKREAQTMRLPPLLPAPDVTRVEFAFADENTLPGAHSSRVTLRPVPPRHSTTVEFSFAQPGEALGAHAYAVEAPPQEDTPLLPHASTTVNFTFAKPGETPGAHATEVPLQHSSSARAFLLPATEERRGRSPTRRSRSLTVKLGVPAPPPSVMERGELRKQHDSDDDAAYVDAGTAASHMTNAPTSLPLGSQRHSTTADDAQHQKSTRPVLYLKRQ